MSVKATSLSFRFFEFFFLTSLFIFPLLLGAANLWGFAIGAVFLCSSFAIHWFKQLPQEDRVLRTELDPLIAAYLVFFFLSLVFSKVPYLSWLEFYKLSVVLCAFLATRYLCRERLQIYRLARGFALMGGLFSVIGLLQFVGGLPNDWWAKAYFLSSTYVNHNHFAGFLVLTMPISFGLVLAERDKPKKIFFVFLLALMGVAFVFTLSRGAMVALAVAMMWMMWTLRKCRLISSSVLPFAILVVLVVGAVIVFGTDNLEQRIRNIQAMTQEEELSLQFRILTWQGTLGMIARFFWWGGGPGTFAHLFLQFRPEGGFFMRPAYALNDFLHLWSECGIFTFLATSALTFVFFRSGLRIIRRDGSRLRGGVGSGVMAGILGLLVHGLFDFNFHIPANWLLSAVAAGLLFSMDEDKYYTSKRPLLVLRTLISASLVILPAVSFYLGITHYDLWEAKQLFKEGEKKSALAAADRGLRLNPFDAELYYLRGFFRQSLAGKTMSEADRQRSVKDFDAAIRLNPYEPVYDLAKARVLTPLLADGSPAELVALFEKAIVKDPNNQLLGFLTAKEIFTRQGPDRPALRDLVGEMLMKRRETHVGLVSYLEQRDLWQYHRPYHLKLLGVRPEEHNQEFPKDLWSRPESEIFLLNDFSNAGGFKATKDELWYRNAELSKKINVRNPLLRIVLRAKGGVLKGVYPSLYVKIDGKLVDEYYVDSSSYKNYFTDVKLTPGEHVLGLAYVNDLNVGRSSSQDRNVWIKRVFLLEV